MSSAKIIEDEKGQRYCLPERAPGTQTMPTRIMLPLVDEQGNALVDGQGRPRVKMVDPFDLLRDLREKRWTIVGFID